MVVRKPGDALEVEPAVVRVGDDIRDLLCRPVEADPADERVRDPSGNGCSAM